MATDTPHSPPMETRRTMFAAASLLLAEAAWVAALLSITKHHSSTTPPTHKALIVALLLGTTAANAAVLLRSTRITLLHVAALYAAHASILCIAVAGPMRADNERIVAMMCGETRSTRSRDVQ